MDDIRANIENDTLEEFRDEFILNYYKEGYNYE